MQWQGHKRDHVPLVGLRLLELELALIMLSVELSKVILEIHLYGVDPFCVTSSCKLSSLLQVDDVLLQLDLLKCLILKLAMLFCVFLLLVFEFDRGRMC